MPGQGAPLRYSAFISYNHRDVKEASWLHRQLETYSVPQRLRGLDTPVGPLGPRLPPVFQDREELAASPDLAQSVRDALEQSASLIVICSPNGARSKWVNEEIRLFTALGRRNRVQCLIVGGIPNASRLPGFDSEQECFPEALFESGGSEPLAADIRPGFEPRRDARLRLIAGVIGVGYDELRQREAARRHRRMALAVTASSIGFVLMAGLATFALISRAEAVKQRDLARQKSITAERTVDFVKSLFTTSDPSEAQGQTITARAILDAGAKRIETELADEPTVKAELATTLGEVYAGLGLYREGDRIVRMALALPGVEPDTRARQHAAHGEALARQGEYKPAIAAYSEGLKILRASEDPAPDLEARLLVGRGEARSSLDDFAGAEADIAAALTIEQARVGARHPALARVLEARAVNAMFADDLASSRQAMEQALAIRLKAQGDRHPKVAEDLNLLGAVSYLQQDSRSAEAYYRRALAADRVVLGPEHPDVANTTNNLARVVLERRGYAEARALLGAAIASNLKQRPETHDDMAFMFMNLGLAEAGLGAAQEAERLLAKAQRAADLHLHRNRGPILTERAALACDAGRAAEGLALLEPAVALTRADYRQEGWRMAWLETIRASCLLRAGKQSEAAALLKANSPLVQERWPQGSLFRERHDRIRAEAGLSAEA